MVDIIVALITGGLMLVGVIVTNSRANQKMLEEIDISNAVTVEKMNYLEKKMDKHNQVIERVFKLEGEMKEVQHDIRDMKNKS